jgi:hypothetical protein
MASSRLQPPRWSPVPPEKLARCCNPRSSGFLRQLTGNAAASASRTLPAARSGLLEWRHEEPLHHSLPTKPITKTRPRRTLILITILGVFVMAQYAVPCSAAPIFHVPRWPEVPSSRAIPEALMSTIAAPRRPANPERKGTSYLAVKLLTSTAILALAIAFVLRYVFRYYLHYNQAAFTDAIRGRLSVRTASVFCESRPCRDHRE